MEEAMQVWTINELMHLTREELCNLVGEIDQVLHSFEPGTIDRLNALTSLDNIRRVMSWRGLHH
jgi:hypothetical protein